MIDKIRELTDEGFQQKAVRQELGISRDKLMRIIADDGYEDWYSFKFGVKKINEDKLIELTSCGYTAEAIKKRYSLTYKELHELLHDYRSLAELRKDVFLFKQRYCFLRLIKKTKKFSSTDRGVAAALAEFGFSGIKELRNSKSMFKNLNL